MKIMAVTFPGQGRSLSGLLNLLCGASNVGKVSSACGQHEVQYTEWRINERTCNCTSVYKFTCVCVYTCCAIQNILMKIGIVHKKYNLQPRLGCFYF